MKKNVKKNDTASLLREPKAKNKFGLKVKPIAMPHEDLIKSPPPQLELVADSESNIALESRQTRLSSLSSQPSLTRQTSVAPERNYQKVANSISKEAVPAGLFKGKSKQLYDALYTLTRGAIKPVRLVRVTKSKLMKLSNIGSRITFESNIRHLEHVGLIAEIVHTGEHLGNEFEVFLPEETLTRQTSLSSQTSSTQKLDRLVCLETRQTSQSSEPINTGVADTPKTSFKDSFKTDDEKAEIFSDFIEKFEQAAIKLTGKHLSKYDKEKWGNLADLLILELEVAAKYTNGISSLPAFLTEVLRRKLFAGREVSAKQNKTGRTSDTVGSSETDDFAVTPLDETGRQKVLAELSDFKDDDFLEDFQKWYTAEDWVWLKENLK